MTLNGGSHINGNTAVYYGGGIFNDVPGTVTLNSGSWISSNTTGRDGGGIYTNGDVDGSVTLNGGSHINGNEPDNCAPAGSVPGCSD